MYVFLSILIFLASIFLILIVLVQNSKGGGLASGFSSSNQIMGVRKTTDFLEKATWGLAGSVVVLSILIASFIPKGDAQQKNEQEAEIQQQERRCARRSERHRPRLWLAAATTTVGRAAARRATACSTATRGPG